MTEILLCGPTHFDFSVQVDNKTWVAPSSVHTASTTTAVRSTARTTSSSNAVVVPTKHVATKEIKSKDMDHDFWDENEAAEREAALSSPIKGKQRLSSAVSNVLMVVMVRCVQPQIP